MRSGPAPLVLGLLLAVAWAGEAGAHPAWAADAASTPAAAGPAAEGGTEAAPAAGGGAPASALPVASPADRAALADVLAGPDFHARRFDGRELRRRLLAWWDALLELLGTAEAERYADLGRLSFFLATTVALLLAWRSIRQRRARAQVRLADSPDSGPAAERPAAAEPQPADAARALARGDLAGAVRAAYVRAAAVLLRAGRRADGPSLTGRELAAVAGDDRLADLAALHERTLFGRRPVAPEEAQRAVDLASSIEASAPPTTALGSAG